MTPTVTPAKRPTREPVNPDNPLTQYLGEILEEDRDRWLYERARIRKETGLSKSHLARIVDGHGCSLDLALQLNTLTNGKVDPRGMCPTVPWERLDAYYATLVLVEEPEAAEPAANP